MSENFDLFSFEDCSSMLAMLADPIVTVVAAGGQTPTNYPTPPGTSCDVGVLSGELLNGGFSTADVRISAVPVDGVSTQFTLQWIVTFESLPDDFASLAAQHVYFGGSDASGPCAGIFISTDGIAYTGSVHHVANSLVTDAPVTPIPGTSQHIVLGVETAIRLVVDGLEGVVYLYITPETDVFLTGHRLVAILPLFDASEMTFSPTDKAFISVRGTTLEPSRIALDAWKMSSELLIPNLLPVADAGTDQAARLCSVVQLNGLNSFDPEGAPLSFSWRLINAPASSIYTVSGNDGRTLPLGPPTGFTNKLHSTSLGVAHAAEALVAGDVLLVEAVTYDIVSTGTDGGGFFVLISAETLPEPLTGKPYRVFRQHGVSSPTTVKPTFLPDVLGFYRFDLVVDDGDLASVASATVINVVDSALPRGITPDANFLFDYLSDYWSLLEDREPIATIWSGMMQVAAAELYTLWQYEYSKSLRDIQRTFLRRWLHYDLLLAEPIPEITSLRIFYGGMRTTAMPAVGSGGVSGTSFVISSAVHPNRTITILSANLVTAPVLAAELLNRLREVDLRYTTQVITRLGGTQLVRINAPFLFTVVSSSVPVLSAGSSSIAHGAAGAAISSRVYKTEDSLDGLGLKENDLLILGTEAFRIAQIVTDPADDVPFMRVILKSDIPLDVTDWSVSGYVRSELLDFYNGLVSLGDSVFFEVVDNDSTDPHSVSSLVETTALGTPPGDLSDLAFVITQTLSVAIATPDRFSVRLAKVVRATYVPVDSSVVDIPTLSELIDVKDDTQTLRRNVDFFIEEYRGVSCLRFESGQLDDNDVWEGEIPPDRLWAEYTYLDNRPTIENNFGLLAEVSIDEIDALADDVDYLSAVRGIWYAYTNGPTMFNLRVGSQILLGLPFAEEAGTIEEIRTDFSPTRGRILVRDAASSEIVRSYTFPRTLDLEVNPDTGVAYVLGDAVKQFAPLVEGVEIIDYVKDPTWYQGLLHQGIFYEVEKFFRFLVRVDSAAFGLESLSFVRNFLLNIKPKYTYPLFLVLADLGNDTEVSVTDQVVPTVTVRLLDTPCGDLTPFSTSFDDPRASSGGFWNQFDTDSNLVTAPPTFPTPDAVEWAFDRYVLCPEDILDTHCCQTFAAPALASTGVNLDAAQHLFNDARFIEAGPFTVANGATGEAITTSVGATVPKNGTVVALRLLIVGGPGSDPATYELIYAVNGVDQPGFAFTSLATFTHVTFVTSHAVLASDVITARVRHAGGSPRSPAWTSVRVDVSIDLGTFASGDLLPIGNYCASRSIT